MKLKALKEKLEEAQNVSDLWDLMMLVAEHRSHIVSLTKASDGWIGEVQKETVKVSGKDTSYHYSSVLKVKGNSFEEAARNALSSFLDKQ